MASTAVPRKRKAAEPKAGIAALQPSPPISPSLKATPVDEDVKDEFDELFNAPLPPPAQRIRTGTSIEGGGNVSCHALVLDVAFRKRNRTAPPGGEYFQLEVTALPYRFFSADKAPDVLDIDGIPGEAYVVPTEKITSAPSPSFGAPGMPGAIDAMAAAAANKSGNGANGLVRRELELASVTAPFGSLAVIKASFSIDLKNAKNPDGTTREPTYDDAPVKVGQHVNVNNFSA